MKSSRAKTVDEFLQELTPERRDVINAMRTVINENLPAGYVETINWGMISYEIPLERFSETYNGKPLAYLMLAPQKRHNSLYMLGVYGDPQQEKRLKQAYKAADKKIDMGKSCVRFNSLDDLPIEMIAELIRETEVDDMIAIHNRVHKK